MTPTRRYFVLDLGVGAAFVNFGINGALAFLMFRSMDAVPLWDGTNPAIGAEIIGTCFLLPFITCLIVTPLAHRFVNRGRIEASDRPLPRWAPRRLLWRAAFVGAATTALVAPVLVALLVVLDVGSLRLTTFLWSKAVFAALLSIPVTPLIGVLALRGYRAR